MAGACATFFEDVVLLCMHVVHHRARSIRVIRIFTCSRHAEGFLAQLRGFDQYCWDVRELLWRFLLPGSTWIRHRAESESVCRWAPASRPSFWGFHHSSNERIGVSQLSLFIATWYTAGPHWFPPWAIAAPNSPNASTQIQSRTQIQGTPLIK